MFTRELKSVVSASMRAKRSVIPPNTCTFDAIVCCEFELMINTKYTLQLWYFSDCVKAAFSRWACYYDKTVRKVNIIFKLKWIESRKIMINIVEFIFILFFAGLQYGRDARFKHLSDELFSLTAHCINIDCRNNCVGMGRCKPYHRPACVKCLNVCYILFVFRDYCEIEWFRFFFLDFLFRGIGKTGRYRWIIGC